MNDLTQYRSVCGRLRPGDVIAFAGREPISWLIRWATGSPLSHIAVVRQGCHQSQDVTISESTLNHSRNGAQTNRLGETLAHYGDGAQAAALILKEDFRRSIDLQKFYAFLGAAETYVHYDVEGLFGFLARELPILGPYLCQAEDPRQMFCNAYVIAAFEASGALRGINYRKTTPQDMAEMAIYAGAVPLLGRPFKIRHFNTV